MKKLFIIKAGSTFESTAKKYGDFEDMTVRGLDIDPELIEIVHAYRGEPLPLPESCCGTIITGAHCMVTDDLPWSLAIEGWIRTIVEAEIPLLGICYGHQLLGRAMGGQVGYHPQGKEVGTFEIMLQPEAQRDVLFSGLPDRFLVHATHSQSVLTLPPETVLLAGNDFEPYHAMRVGRCAWGVQFHPEYHAGITRDYVEAQAKALLREGQDVEALLAGVKETPEAATLLKQFARITLG